MADWYTPEWHPDTKVITSEKGFTTNEIAIEFLRHYIAHSNAGPHSEEWKLLLMDNHGSHDTPAFLRIGSGEQDPAISSYTTFDALYATT